MFGTQRVRQDFLRTVGTDISEHSQSEASPRPTERVCLVLPSRRKRGIQRSVTAEAIWETQLVECVHRPVSGWNLPRTYSTGARPCITLSAECKIGVGGLVTSWMTLPLGLRWDVSLTAVIRVLTERCGRPAENRAHVARKPERPPRYSRQRRSGSDGRFLERHVVGLMWGQIS